MGKFIFIFIALSWTLFDKCNGSCFHGQETDGGCKCDEGWSGPDCQHCTGRFVVNDNAGFISDGNYSRIRIVDCSWAILQSSETVNMTLKITLSNEKISCNGVTLQIYDGESVFSPLLATYDKSIQPGTEPTREIIATSGSAFLKFYGPPPTRAGYNIYYKYVENTFDLLPEDTFYPTNSSSSELPWTSYDWSELTAQGRGSASMAADDDFTYIYGGLILGDDNDRKQMLRINLTDFGVQSIEADNTPEPRYGHSMVSWQDELFIFGGLKLNDYSITNELWSFNTSSGKWNLISDNSSPYLYGHTAHLVELGNGNKEMVVIFGYHPDWRYSNFVFHYNVEMSTWENSRTTGAIVHGTFGHASALDSNRNIIYVYGGQSYSQITSEKLIMYDVEERSWNILYSTMPEGRYLHSMVFLNNSLLIYGGKSVLSDPNCSVLPFMSYDLTTGEWSELDSIYPRFGHSAFAKSEMIMFGGFDGIMHADAFSFAFDPPTCENFTDSECDSSSNCSLRSSSNCTEQCNMTEDECNAFCQSYYSCNDCLSISLRCCGCTYCNASGTCLASSSNSTCDDVISDLESCNANVTRERYCESFVTCSSCKETEECFWSFTCVPKYLGNESSICVQETPQMFNTCSSCTDDMSGLFQWCETTQTCFRASDQSVLYPYGSCTDIRSSGGCEDVCSGNTNCDYCFDAGIQCGWCSDDDETGQGSCMKGTVFGPMTMDTCQGNWTYNVCPECQCNGHSTCVNDSVCADCDSNTNGDECQLCDVGYYGNPLNGANCSVCQCNGHAESCESEDDCLCNVYGITGSNCQRCLNTRSFEGDPVNDTCYYHLDPGFRYTFRINQPNIKMNFDFCPPQKSDYLMIINSDVDGDGQSIEYFDALMTYNMTGSDNITVFANFTNTTYVRMVFHSTSINFDKSCIRVYMNFVPDISFYVQLQENPFSILVVIAIVTAVFVLLLVMAAVFWKLNSMFLRYRRRRERAVELRVMAARPYACIDYDYMNICDDRKDTSHLTHQTMMAEAASVDSVLLWIPSGDAQDNLQPTLAIGTALVKSKPGVKVKTKQAVTARKGQASPASQAGIDNPALDLQNPDLGANNADST